MHNSSLNNLKFIRQLAPIMMDYHMPDLGHLPVYDKNK